MKYFLFTLIFLLASIKINAQKIYGGSFSRAVTTGALKGQPFSYGFDCRFFADAIAKNTLPQQLRFRIFRKKDNVLIQEFMADKQAKIDSTTITGSYSCVTYNSPVKTTYSIVKYYHERIINPTDFNDSEGYYVINDPVGPRSITDNIQSSNIILYHWFSPKYLFEQLNDGDDGKLASGWTVGGYGYNCSGTTGSFRYGVSMQPSQSVVNGKTFKLVVKSSVPLTNDVTSFKTVEYKSGLSPTNVGVNSLSFTQASPTWQNTNPSQVANGISVFRFMNYLPPRVGKYALSLIAEHYRNDEKIAENTYESQIEINECITSKNNVFQIVISDVGNPTKFVSSIVCLGKSVQLNAGALNYFEPLHPDIEYQWYKNDKPIVGETSKSTIIKEGGKYYLASNVKGDCNPRTTSSISVIFIDCQLKGDPSILGNSLHSNSGSTGGNSGMWWNRLWLKSDYYIPVKDLPRMPTSIKATLYRKRDNFKLDEMVVERNDQKLMFLPRACGTGVDTMLVVGYNAVIELLSSKYPKTPDGYYAITEPVCCRATNDNMAQSKTKVVTYAEFNGADQVLLEELSQKDLLLEVGIPARIDACIGQDMNIAFNVINKQNISAKLVGLVEVISEETGLPPFKKEGWKTDFSTLNFGGSSQNFQVVQEGNRFIIKGVPKKVGTYTYRVKFDGMMNGVAYSSVYSEFQIKVRDCSKPLQPTIFISKVGKPNQASPATVCQDSLIQLNLRNFSKGSTFQWKIDNNDIAGEKDSIIIIKNSQGGSYACTAFQPQLCPEKMDALPAKITFLPKPTTTVTASSPTGTLCQGGIVKLTAVSNPSNVKYQWLRENLAVNGATNSIFDASESGNYTVRITTNEGCTNLSTAQNVVSNTPPKAEITSSNKVICKGKDVSISATSGTGNTYVWTRDGVTIPENTATFTTNQTGNYVVKITAPNTCSTVSKPFKVIQLDNPEVNIVNPNGIQLCQGSTINFTLKGNTLQSFQWLKDGQVLANETKNTLSVSQAGEYTVSVIDTNGCTNTSTNEKINIVNKVIVTLDSIPPICGVNSPTIALKASPSGGTFSGLGVSGSDFNPNIAGIGTHKITYNINGNLACLTGSVQRNIIVSAVPSITFNSSNSGKICVGDKVKISPNVQNATVFQWFKENTIITGANQNTFETTEAGRYRLELSNSNNCKAVSTDFEVQIFPRTTVTLDSVPSFCGTAFSAIALKANPAGGTFTGNGIAGNSFDPKIAGVGTHTISYKLTRDPACAGGEVTRKVVITPPPILNLGADRDVFQGQTVKLNGDLGTGYQYQWNPPLGLDNPLIPRPLAKPSQTTTYFIRATGPNNCVAADTITLNVINIIYVPNIFTPNADGLNDTWDISGLETYPDVEISIFNRWGNMVYYAKGNKQKSFDGIFQERPLPEDIYAFVINTNHKEYVVRGTILLQR